MPHLAESPKLGFFFDKFKAVLLHLGEICKQSPERQDLSELKQLYPYLNEEELGRLFELKAKSVWGKDLRPDFVNDQCAVQSLINLNEYLGDGGTREDFLKLPREKRCLADFQLSEKH